MKKLTRRDYLKKSAVALGTVFLTGQAARAGLCNLTPEQTEGPFYPNKDQADKDNDLTIIKGSNKIAEGEVVVLKGVVTDENCQPVAGALVEIWQACATGKYNHSADPNPAKLDPNFQYWGKAITNEKGEYSFKTIRPGQYEATRNWKRPSHIHLKASRRGYAELTTQVYFKGDPYNGSDRILQSLSGAERKNVIVDFKEAGEGQARVGEFQISIKSL